MLGSERKNLGNFCCFSTRLLSFLHAFPRGRKRNDRLEGWGVDEKKGKVYGSLNDFEMIVMDGWDG
jgi:hypothetical protein